MPDILIRGMEMPQNCIGCPFTYDGLLGLSSNICDSDPDCYTDSKYENCPLHELPPHGDLIDRDEVVNLTDYYEARFAIFRSPKIFVFMQGQAFDVMRRIIKKAVAVVPASEEGG